MDLRANPGANELVWQRRVVLTSLIAASPRPRAAAGVPDSGFTFGQRCPSSGRVPLPGTEEKGHEIHPTHTRHRQGGRRRFIAGAAGDGGRLVGRRPGRRRHEFGLPGRTDVFRVAEHFDGPEYGTALQPYLYPT